jgi:phage terminase small subunit
MGAIQVSILSPKQAAFVREYLIDLNATQAAIRAGYSQKTAAEQAARLLTNVKVKAEVQTAMDNRADKTGITQDYVLKTIHETVERCRQATPVVDRKGEQVFVKTPTGELVPAYLFDAKSVLRGCELLGKHLGMFTDRHELTGKNGGPIETVEVSELEIARRAAFLLESAAQHTQH